MTPALLPETPPTHDSSDVAFARRLRSHAHSLIAEQAQLRRDEQSMIGLRQQLCRVQAALETGNLVTAFQPIVSLADGSIIGWEALSRFDLDPVRPPDQWFAEAHGAGLGLQLELRAIEEAVRGADRLPRGRYLSVNASPQTLLSPDFERAMASLESGSAVVEVTEHAVIDDYRLLSEGIARLRERGIRLAIDDAGAGFASFKHIVKLLPEFIKIDRSLIDGIDSDGAKQALTAAMLTFAERIGSHLLAEGVETAAEAQVLRDLGVEYAQGYHFGRPVRRRP